MEFQHLIRCYSVWQKITRKFIFEQVFTVRCITLHNAGGYYIIQFITCSAKAAVRAERKKIMKNERQKQNYEAMEPSKKRMFIEKKQARDTTNKLELQKKRVKRYETMDSAKKQHLLNKQAENTKLWIQQRNKTCETNKQKNTKLCMQQKKKNYFRNRNKNTVVIKAKAWIHALIHLKRKLRKVHIIYVVCAIGCSTGNLYCNLSQIDTLLSIFLMCKYHLMEKFISVTHVTQKLFKERFHVRQL